jgi:acyl-CoA thioester hydrolase
MDLTPLPITYRAVIPDTFRDENNHMNVMWYVHLFDQAAGGFFPLFGIDRAYCEANLASTFALEHHIRYLREVRIGQAVTVRSRAVGRSAKRFHFMQFLVIDESGELAATEEAVGTHMDMQVRRTSPMPPHIVAAYERILEAHARLPWPAPICGVMKA